MNGQLLCQCEVMLVHGDVSVMSWHCVFRGGAPGSEAEDSARDRSAGGRTDGDLRSDQS